MCVCVGDAITIEIRAIFFGCQECRGGHIEMLKMPVVAINASRRGREAWGALHGLRGPSALTVPISWVLVCLWTVSDQYIIVRKSTKYVKLGELHELPIPKLRSKSAHLPSPVDKIPVDRGPQMTDNISFDYTLKWRLWRRAVYCSMRSETMRKHTKVCPIRKLTRSARVQ